jgi:hypothetical protein
MHFVSFQAMYCSEKCSSSDWTSAHKGECNKLSHPISTGPFKLDEMKPPSPDSIQSTVVRLISRIGLNNIKKTVLENKHMPSLLGDPRTKGFQDGKFETATLEALLSLEDNFGKLTREELFTLCCVSSFLMHPFRFVFKIES